jgi:hypothetical protein
MHLRVKRSATLLAMAFLLMGCATSPPMSLPLEATGGSGDVPEPQPPCGGRTAPEGWPRLSSERLRQQLTEALSCASPGDYVAWQEHVDMPWLVASLDAWSAVRLGALGPVRSDALDALTRQRAAFLVEVTERYGRYHAEVFALYVLHSAHDDEVDALLRTLANTRRLGQTLGLMPAAREELARRGMPLSAYPERSEQAHDVWRGLGRAARDALSTSPVSDGSRYSELAARRAQLPGPYQRASHEVERALALRHFDPESVTQGSLDAVTFGVPLGFYYLVQGTRQGVASLAQGHYEQATRELAPALLVGVLSMGNPGTRPRLTLLRERVRGLETALGVEGLRALAQDIQASQEAGRFVAVGGMDAALALHEARGDVARAQALMTKARPEATGSTVGKRGAGERSGSLASLVDAERGLTQEVVEARLAQAEFEATGPRLPRDVAVLEKRRPVLDDPPPEARGHPRWPEYVEYYDQRLGEVKVGKAPKGPLPWEAYEQLRGGFARGLEFERSMVALLRNDAARPRAQRRFLGDFDTPRIETSVGVMKPGTGLRFADVLILETNETRGQPPRVETFSFKSRDLSGLTDKAVEAQIKADANEALSHYGETLRIRRGSLQSLLPEGREVRVTRVRLVYEGGVLKPTRVDDLDALVERAEKNVPGVEVLFQ